MKKKTYMRHIWMLLDDVSEKVANIEAKIDLLKNENISFNSQKIMDLIEDSNDNKKEIMEIKAMIRNLSNQIAAKESPVEEKNEEVKKTPTKEEPKQKPEEKKAPVNKSTKKTSAKNK